MNDVIQRHIVQRVRGLIDQHPRLYIIRYDVTRVRCIDRLRKYMKQDTQIFYGEPRAMKEIVGRDVFNEYQLGLSELAPHLNRGAAMVFTTRGHEDILDHLSKHRDRDYANVGDSATVDITLGEGLLENAKLKDHEELKSAGLPLKLRDGHIALDKEFVVCRVGDVFTLKRAVLAKLLRLPTTTFRVKPVVWWDKESGKVKTIK